MSESTEQIPRPSSLPSVESLGLFDMTINKGYIEALNLFFSYEVALKRWLFDVASLSSEIEAEVAYLANSYRLAIADNALGLDALGYLMKAPVLVETAQKHGLTKEEDLVELKTGLVSFGNCASGLSILTGQYKEYVKTLHF